MTGLFDSAKGTAGFSVRKIAKNKWQIMSESKPLLIVPTKTRAMRWIEKKAKERNNDNNI